MWALADILTVLRNLCRYTFICLPFHATPPPQYQPVVWALLQWHSISTALPCMNVIDTQPIQPKTTHCTNYHVHAFLIFLFINPPTNPSLLLLQAPQLLLLLQVICHCLEFYLHYLWVFICFMFVYVFNLRMYLLWIWKSWSLWWCFVQCSYCGKLAFWYARFERIF